MPNNMSLKDWFAGMALQAMLRQDGVFKNAASMEKLAAAAYDAAEAMMKVQKERQEKDRLGD